MAGICRELKRKGTISSRQYQQSTMTMTNSRNYLVSNNSSIRRCPLWLLAIVLLLLSLARQAAGTDNIDQLRDLLPFRVKLFLTNEAQTVDANELRRQVQLWLTQSFETKVLDDISSGISNSNFQLVRILLDDITTGDPYGFENEATTFETLYTGVSIWDRDGDIPGNTIVAGYQIGAIVDAAVSLLANLQADNFTRDGLGENIFDLKAEITTTPVDDPDTPTNPPTNDGSGGGGLNTVIIVAIVIAALACALLAFAMFMAWRQNKQRSSAYRSDTAHGKSANATDTDLSPDANGRGGSGGGGGRGHSRSGSGGPGASGANGSRSGSRNGGSRAGHSRSGSRASGASKPVHSPPPSEIGNTSDIGGGLYPDSVISEDISTSLTAYYKSGMAAGALSGANARLDAGGLNDAASVSSMESYGYSLDGYASTIGGKEKK